MQRLLAVLLVGLSLAACHKAEEAKPEGKPKQAAAAPVPVAVAQVQLRDMPRILTLTGSVTAQNQSEVAANVAGRIVKTTVERGQRVKKGEIIAVVDASAAALSASAANAQASLADAQSVQAQQDCARNDRLFQQAVISEAEYERQNTQCKAQQFSANAARAQAGLASRLAADTNIRAPFDGAIGERYINVGEYVQPATRVASVFVFDPVRVTISVPENVVAQIGQGQTLDVRVAAWPGRTFPAAVEYISPALRQNTRDLIVEATAANGDAALRPGMFATVELKIGDEHVPTVPKDALLIDGTVSRLFVIEGGKAKELVVRTGIERDGVVAIFERFDERTVVVRKPPADLRDGSTVAATAPVPTAAPAPAPQPSTASTP